MCFSNSSISALLYGGSRYGVPVTEYFSTMMASSIAHPLRSVAASLDKIKDDVDAV